MLEHYQEFISGPDIAIMAPAHDDPRRTIREALITAPGSPLRRVTEIAVKSPKDGETMVLGNHYHAKPEDFTIVDGSPLVITAHVSDPSNITTRTLNPGDTITMQPGEAHKFIFGGSGELRSTMEGTLAESGTKNYYDF